MNISRLQRLIEILKVVPVTAFDITYWSNVDTNKKHDIIAPTHENVECGYVCCAVGWACLDKELTDHGLLMINSRPVYETYSAIYEGMDAVTQFFDIPLSMANHLFMAFSYPDYATSPQDVIDRIQELIDSEVI